jgi:TolB protein
MKYCPARSLAKHLLRPAGLFVFAVLLSSASLRAQDWFKTETSAGVSNIRIAVADFKPVSADPQGASLKQVFDTTLFNDLTNAGIFDVVSKSLLPQATPGAPGEMNLAQWSSAPTNAAMVAFGAFGASGGRITVNGFLFDAKNTQFPQVLAKQYNEDANEEMARQVAHRFADEIIFRLGGGVPGIAETKIYYVKVAGGNKEIWAMDYSLGKNGFQIRMYSLLLNRMVSFPSGGGGTNLSPAWSPNGNNIAFSSSRTGDPEIYIADASGGAARRVTSFRGPDVSPVFNPKTGAQIAWISGRTHLPQLYIMDTDGSAVTRLTDGGYATSPSWSPNGQFIAFAWDRKYGPGAPGGQDIYVMEVATKRWIQVTHDIGRCDFPSWSPDGRHIVFANSPDGRASSTRIVSMLADGTGRRNLTGPGADMPNWSWK